MSLLQALKISIVTPSYNQATFLEATINSVLSQSYSNFEYIIIDGRSTDDTLNIIRRYSDDLAFWCSEPDRGQYDAINKGFQHSTGDIMAWINSDDMYTPWAFKVVSEIFNDLPQVEWITTLRPLRWSATGAAIFCHYPRGYTRRGFLKGENVPYKCLSVSGAIQQESVFWRRSLWEKTGAHLDTSYSLAADFELWARFFQYADLYTVPVPLGGFRAHGDQRSVICFEQYIAETHKALAAHGGQPMGILHRAVIKLAKRSLELPVPARRWAAKWGLKSPHWYCTYDSMAQRWKADIL